MPAAPFFFVAGTIALMAALDYSIDNISLLAITLAVGLVVDDAVVMLENIVRHLEDGMEPFRAAIIGSREMGFTILSISFSLVAVFIPIFFMPGVIGSLFHEFAGRDAQLRPDPGDAPARHPHGQWAQLHQPDASRPQSKHPLDRQDHHAPQRRVGRGAGVSLW